MRDSIKSTMIPKSSRNRLERKVPNAKHTRTYPALLIGRLGVNGQFQRSGLHLGSQVIDYLISWFIHPDNKTGCRLILPKERFPFFVFGRKSRERSLPC
jgi:hypothetical protein